MSVKHPIEKITIRGFKSITDLDAFPLYARNILIGSNGAGKSNFVSYFRMLNRMVDSRLQEWVTDQGGADRIVSYGIKETDRLQSFIQFGPNGYRFSIKPTVDGEFSFVNEELFFDGPYYGHKWDSLGRGHKEAKLKEAFKSSPKGAMADYCYSSIANWKVFHFHDTSDTAGVKRWGALHDNEYLRPDASNLAACLYKLQEESEDTYEQIRKTVRLAIPFFDDFFLKPRELRSGEKQINLQWRQQGSDYALWPSQLSDGSIRFICLTVALMQPDPPSTIIIDEPELGLHPYAIVLLGALLRSASKRMQVIVSTQSIALVNEFCIDDLVVVERKDGSTVFQRLAEDDFAEWLETYSVGELWEKNILGGRPR